MVYLIDNQLKYTAGRKKLASGATSGHRSSSSAIKAPEVLAA